MSDHDHTPEHGWMSVPRLLLLLAGFAIALVGTLLLGLQLQTHAEGSDNMTTITITDSGSTNTPGSTLTINPDGSGSIHYEKGAWPFERYSDRTFAPHTFPSDKFSALMAEIKDVRTIPNHGCLKSLSFGSVITMTYRGETSGDISCLSAHDGKVFHDLRTLVLDIYASIVHSNEAKHPEL